MVRTATLCAALALLIPFSAFARGKDLEVTLEFTPQEGVHSESPDLAPSMLERPFDLRVEDGRAAADPLAIGKGTDDDDEVFTIRANSNVADYVKSTVAALSSDWGLKSSASADRVLNVKVSRFYIEESNKALGSMYASEVKLSWTLTDATGKALAEGAGSGSAHRYGRARSADNCSEVLSDALKEAYGDVLATSRLQTAWTTGKADSSTSSSAAAPEQKGSVEERLRKLDELLQKKLITKEEYDKKRAEILKDV